MTRCLLAIQKLIWRNSRGYKLVLPQPEVEPEAPLVAEPERHTMAEPERLANVPKKHGRPALSDEEKAARKREDFLPNSSLLRFYFRRSILYILPTLPL